MQFFFSLLLLESHVPIGLILSLCAEHPSLPSTDVCPPVPTCVSGRLLFVLLLSSRVCVVLRCKPHTVTFLVICATFNHSAVSSISDERATHSPGERRILSSPSIHNSSKRHTIPPKQTHKLQWQCVCRAAQRPFDLSSWPCVFIGLFSVILAGPKECEVCVLVV